MAKIELAAKINIENIKEATEEVSQLIALLKEANTLIDSISSKEFKNQVVVRGNH